MAGTEVMALANDPPSDVHLNQALTPPVPLYQLSAGELIVCTWPPTLSSIPEALPSCDCTRALSR